MEWPEQEAFISFKQRNNKLVKNWQDQEVWALGSKQWRSHREDKREFNEVCVYRFLDSRLPPLVWEHLPSSWLGGHLSHVCLKICFREEWQGGKGQSDLPTSAFLKNSFSLRCLIYQGSTFWGSMSWTPSLLSPFYRWGKVNKKRLSSWPEVAHLISCSVWFGPRYPSSRVHDLNHCYTK